MACRKTRGSVLVVVMVFVAIFGALAVGYAAATNANLRNAQRYLDGRRAHLAAESGLSLAEMILPTLNVQNAKTAEETLAAVATDLNNKYGSTLPAIPCSTVLQNLVQKFNQRRFF